MKNFAALLFIFSLIVFISCDKCEDEPPKVRMVNHGTDKADIQIKTSGGNTENINGVEVGQVTPWRSFDKGNIEFTVSVKGLDSSIVYVLYADICYEYTITIDPSNKIVKDEDKVE